MEGLKTISGRLSKMETKVNKMRNVEFEDEFDDIILDNIRRKEKYERKKQITKIKEHFKLGLMKQIDVENTNNIVDIIIYSIKWIESNSHQLSNVMGLSVNSDFKLNSCVGLIKELVKDYDNDFLSTSIITLVDIIYNSNKNIPPPEIIEPVEEVKKLSRKKSIKKKMFSGVKT